MPPYQLDYHGDRCVWKQLRASNHAYNDPTMSALPRSTLLRTRMSERV